VVPIVFHDRHTPPQQPPDLAALEQREIAMLKRAESFRGFHQRFGDDPFLILYRLSGRKEKIPAV
jgi:hypothetical protein